MKHFLLLLAALILGFTGAARAQTTGPAPTPPPPLFPFVLPWDDAAPGTITDVSFLNAKPAGVHGAIIAKNGHFIESGTGSRIRFLGTDFTFRAAFPSHADAEKVAARIAKLGINIVRLHHMDNIWGADSSIWDYTYPDRQHISASQLDKLDYLIAQFKKNGVYVNLNLHVSRQFSEADGFPPSVAAIPFGLDKRVDEFDPRMILLQKNYARDLLSHVNPYTHLSYAADPAVAVVEINNENSLVGDPWAGLGADLDTLPEPFRGELVGDWNAWLVKKYGTDAKLQAAWTQGVTPTGPGLLFPSSQWSSEDQRTSHVDISQSNTMPLSSHLPSFGSVPLVTLRRSAPDIQASITQTDDTDWHVQVHQTGLDLKNGDTYTVTFRAKADKERVIPVGASLDEADWRNVGLSANASLGTDWKTFRYVFTAHDAVPNHVRLAFVLGKQTGSVWIDSLQIHPGVDNAGLSPGQSLAAKTVDIPVSATQPQHDDWISFLADTERAYADEMRGYLKDTLHVQANVICSQISWGGLTGINREANMDFADNHAYWQHPSFPHKAWDSKDWNIGNTPMVADLADGKGGTLLSLAENRIAGKPYSISEYNHPAPNDYRAETLPLLATFAAFQDWDAIYLFDYGDYGTGIANDKINSFFGISSDPAKTAFLPAAAMIFRANLFPSAKGSSECLRIPTAQFLSTPQAADAWKSAYKQQAEFPFGWMAINIDPHRSPQSGAGRDGIIVDYVYRKDTLFYPDTPQVTHSSSGAQYIAASASTCSLVGYVGGTTADLDAQKDQTTVNIATLNFPRFGNNFAALTLTAMDQKPLIQSHKLLLTLVGKVENQGMGWNADRTSVGDQWGHGPTVAEGIPATVTLTIDKGRHVYALDGTGKRTEEVLAKYAAGTLTFTVGPQYKTLWYEIAGDTVARK